MFCKNLPPLNCVKYLLHKIQLCNSCVLSKVDPAANKRFFISDNKREIVLHFYTNQ